jgi:hypothetical protein
VENGKSLAKPGKLLVFDRAYATKAGLNSVKENVEIKVKIIGSTKAIRFCCNRGQKKPHTTASFLNHHRLDWK